MFVSGMYGLPPTHVGSKRMPQILNFPSNDQSANDEHLAFVKRFLDGGTCNLKNLFGSMFPTRLLYKTEMKEKLASLHPKAISLGDYVDLFASTTPIEKFRLSDETLHIMSSLDYQIDLRLDVVKGTTIKFVLDLDFVQMVIGISTHTTDEIATKAKVIREKMVPASSSKSIVDMDKLQQIQNKRTHSRTPFDNTLLKLHDQAEPNWTQDDMAVGLAIWQIIRQCGDYDTLFLDKCSFDYEMKSIYLVDGRKGFHKMTHSPSSIGGKESFVLLNIGLRDMATEPSKVFIRSTNVDIVRAAAKTVVAAFWKSSGTSSDEAKDASSSLSGSNQMVSCNRKLLEMAILLFLMNSNQTITAVFESYNGKTRGLSTWSSLTLQFEDKTTPEELKNFSEQAAEVLLKKFELCSFAATLKKWFDVKDTKLGIGIDTQPINNEDICMLPSKLQNNGTLLLGQKALNAVASNLEPSTVSTDTDIIVDGISTFSTKKSLCSQYQPLLLPGGLNSITDRNIYAHVDPKKDKNPSNVTGFQMYLASFRNVDVSPHKQQNDNTFGSHMGHLQNVMEGLKMRISTLIEECDTIEAKINIAAKILLNTGPKMRVEITHILCGGLTLGSLQNACFDTIMVTKESVIVLNKKVIADYFLLMALAMVQLHRSSLLSASSDTVFISRIAHLSYASITGDYIQNLFSGRAFHNENNRFQQLATQLLQRLVIAEPTNPMRIKLGLKATSTESSDKVVGSKASPISVQNRAEYHLDCLLATAFFPTCLHKSCQRSFFNIGDLFQHLEELPEHKINGNSHTLKSMIVRNVVLSYIKNENLDSAQTSIVTKYLEGYHVITSSCGGSGKTKILRLIIKIHSFLHPGTVLIMSGTKLSAMNLHEDAKTIHSAFGMGKGENLNTAKDFINAFQQTNVDYRPKTLNILDETYGTERRIAEGALVHALEDQHQVSNIGSNIQFLCFGDINQQGNNTPSPLHPTPPLHPPPL